MSAAKLPIVTDYPRRLASLLRILLDCGFFGAGLPSIQTMVVKMRVPKTIIDDAMAILQRDGHVEVRAAQYHRVYPTARAVRPRIGVLTERNIFGHYFEVYQDYLLGISEAIDPAGFDLVFSHALTSTEAKLIAIEEFVQTGAKGIAVLGRFEADVRASILARKIPTVVCGNATIEQREFACVCSDNIFGTKNLVKYLFEIGHRDIAYYATAAHIHDGYHHRIIGYRDAMGEAGLPVREELILDEPHSPSSANAAAQIFSGLKKKPSVIVCASDREAFELISELQKSGVKIPQDVSVAGFENSIFNNLSEPALTTVDIYPREMGRIAGGFLLSEIASRQLPARIVLPSLLIQRGSVLSASGQAVPVAS